MLDSPERGQGREGTAVFVPMGRVSRQPPRARDTPTASLPEARSNSVPEIYGSACGV